MIKVAIVGRWRESIIHRELAPARNALAAPLTLFGLGHTAQAIVKCSICIGRSSAMG